MERYELTYEATPELGDEAMLCAIQRRGRYLLPLLLVAFPLVLFVLAAEPTMHATAALLGGACIMLLLLFLIAAQHRRRVRRRLYALAGGDRTVHVVVDDSGLRVRSVLAESHVSWATIHRMARNARVVLLFYQGWSYLAIPMASIPPGMLEMVQARINARGGRSPSPPSASPSAS